MATNIPKSIRATLYIDGKPAEGSMKNLETVTNRLNRELKLLDTGTEAWNRKMREVKAHQKALQGLRDEIKGTAGAFGFLKTEIGKIGALAAGYLGFQFVTDQFRNIIMSNAELSDSLADVRKTTGLSEEAVRRLQGELKKLDTRSSQKELLGLSEVAGKLGVSGERDILGFVRAADKISVALGKDLGNTEDAVNNLGKITELFKIKDAYGLEDALIRTGSAINSLGAAGTASEAYIVEFTKRLGPIAPAANMSIESILGLAATMDELGQPAEAATTALSQFIVGMGKDIPGFARIAGLSVQEFTNLLKTDGNQALLETLKNLTSTGEGVAGLAEKMGLVGEEGARATAALGALSNNLGLLVSKQKLANDEFEKGTSLQEEFSVKNATFGAVLDRTAKKFRSFTSNTVVVDFLKNMVFGFSQLITWLEKNSVALVTITKLLVVAGTAWGAYRLAIILSSAATGSYTAVTVLARTSALAFAGAQALLAGNLSRAQAAMRALNITMSANPFGVVAALVITMVTAIALFSNSTSEAKQIQEDFNSVEAEAAKNRNNEIQRIKELKAVIDSENTSREQKLKAVNALRLVMPDALKDLTDEEALTNKGTVAINKYVRALEAKTLAEAAQNQIRKLQERNIELDNGSADASGFFDKAGNVIKEFSAGAKMGQNNGLGARFQRGLANAKGNANVEEKEANTRRIKALQEKYGSGMVENLLNVGDVTTGGKSTGGLTDNKAGDKKASEFDQLKKDVESWKGKAAKGDPDSDRELVEIENRYAELMKRAVGHQDEIDEIELTRKTLRDQRWQEIDKENAKKSRENALENLTRAYDQEELARTQRLQERLEQIDASDKSEIEKEHAKTAILAEFEQQTYEARQEQLIARALLLEAQIAIGNLEVDEEKRIAAEKISIQKQVADNAIAEQNRIADKTREINQSRVDSEKNLQLAIFDAMGTGIGLIGGLFKQSSAMAKGFFALEKVAAAAKIIFMHIQEVAAIRLAAAAQIAWASSNPLTMGMIPVIKATQIAQTLTSKINLGAGLATIAAQAIKGFATGGFSDDDPSGFVNRDTVFRRSASGRPFRAGEAGREWIAPNWMLENPRTANIIGMLENARKSRGLATGGSSSSPVTVNSSVDMSELTQKMDAFIEAQNRANNVKYVLVKKTLDDIYDDEIAIRIDIDA